jgi:hypothetical protein
VVPLLASAVLRVGMVVWFWLLKLRDILLRNFRGRWPPLKDSQEEMLSPSFECFYIGMGPKQILLVSWELGDRSLVQITQSTDKILGPCHQRVSGFVR